ncbi:MAG: hypothetical protein NE328_10765 [Lentisphaeraceae bacterium]|nr:hypothetical protein [Lentisphaeraceae bacterium]
MKFKIAFCALLVFMFASCSSLPKKLAVVVVERIDRRPGTNDAVYHLKIVKDISNSFHGQKRIVASLIGNSVNKIFKDHLQASFRFKKEVVCHMVEGRGSSFVYTIFNVEKGDAKEKYNNYTE